MMLAQLTACSGYTRQPTIVGLNVGRCPSTVCRTVRAIVVNAVELMAWSWRRTHVVEKCGEVVSPSVANSDAARSVVTEFRVVRFVAAPTHPEPSVVSRRLSEAMSAIGGLPRLSARHALNAAPGGQLQLKRNAGFAAVAATEPSTLGALVIDGNGDQLTESVPGKVFAWGAHAFVHTTNTRGE